MNNHVIDKDSSMTAGQKVTWDCVYFGSYPQTEIVDKVETCGTTGQGWSKDSDYDIDPELYAALLQASWSDNETTMV